MANTKRALLRAYDLIVYGASGFTGRLVAEHLLETHGATVEIRWAMAGRTTAKLAEVRSLFGKMSRSVWARRTACRAGLCADDAGMASPGVHNCR